MEVGEASSDLGKISEYWNHRNNMTFSNTLDKIILCDNLMKKVI